MLSFLCEVIEVEVNELRQPGLGAPDLVLRPFITGLGLLIFLLRPERFSRRSPLHRWSRWNVVLLAAFFWDPWCRQALADLRRALKTSKALHAGVSTYCFLFFL